VRPTLNVLGAWRVPRRYEDWSAWRLNYNVFCHRDLPATFFGAWLAGAKENGQSAIAAMATRERLLTEVKRTETLRCSNRRL
jgi:hypothetical protein